MPPHDARTTRERVAAGLYEEGKTLEEIAQKLGTTREGARYLAKGGGAKMRRRGRRGTGK